MGVRKQKNDCTEGTAVMDYICKTLNIDLLFLIRTASLARNQRGYIKITKKKKATACQRKN